MQFFKLSIKEKQGKKAKLSELLSAMEQQEIPELLLPDLPLSAVIAYIAGERDSIWSISINNEDMLELVGSMESAQALRSLMETNKRESIVLAPLLRSNVEDYLGGKRNDLIQMELAHVEPGDDFVGHVSSGPQGR